MDFCHTYHYRLLEKLIHCSTVKGAQVNTVEASLLPEGEKKIWRKNTEVIYSQLTDISSSSQVDCFICHIQKSFFMWILSSASLLKWLGEQTSVYGFTFIPQG